MQLRVLLVEDSATDAKLVKREIARGGYDLVTERVDSADEVRRALAEGAWDVVVSDWSMPGFGALEALAIVKASGRDLPFIIVSGTIGEETAVEAMRAGAHDFMLKDRLARLVPAIEREIREAQGRAGQRQAEHALENSELRFSRLAESGIVGILRSEMGGRVVAANDAWLRMIGRSQADIERGLQWDELNPPDWRWHDEVVQAELAATGVARPWQQDLLHSNGSRVPVLVGVAMLGTAECISFVADLSELEQAKAALQSSEAQLRQAQKMEAIGSLAGGVAHDFNNLLSVILSYTSIAMLDLPATDPLRHDLAEIHRAGERAAELTRQLLAFSRRQVLQPKLLDLGEVVAGAEKLLRRLLGEDIELVLERGEDLARVNVDRGQLEQVIMNLAVNARDAMPRGGKLVICTENVELDEAWVEEHIGATVGPHVALRVIDNGMGMDAETQARIFEPFFTTKEVRGTGLGLSTVLGIVGQSGGTIWVRSEPGHGTAFDVYLPQARTGAVAEPRDPRPVRDDARGTETILLVEDDLQVRALATTILRRYGYTVLEAQSGGDALLLCEQHGGRIELLLTDVVMPRLSGRELTERLAVARPGLRTLYMSGYTDDAVLRHGVREAEVAFLQKPFTVETLTRAVRDTLDAPARGTALPSKR